MHVVVLHKSAHINAEVTTTSTLQPLGLRVNFIAGNQFERNCIQSLRNLATAPLPMEAWLVKCEALSFQAFFYGFVVVFLVI